MTRSDRIRFRNQLANNRRRNGRILLVNYRSEGTSTVLVNSAARAALDALCEGSECNNTVETEAEEARNRPRLIKRGRFAI